jgi:hypothetical protein
VLSVDYAVMSALPSAADLSRRPLRRFSLRR